MQYHVPFHLRDQQNAKPPVYIGFDQPRRPRRTFSWLGFGGFLMIIMSCGTLAPIALVLSLLGLRHGPNFFSVTGTILSTIVLAGMVIGTVGDSVESRHRAHQQQQWIQHQQVEKQNKETRKLLANAADRFREFKSENEDKLPTAMAGSLLAVEHTDAWEKELRYEPGNGHALIRSAGADHEFDTGDDLTIKVAGEIQKVKSLSQSMSVE